MPPIPFQNARDATHTVAFVTLSALRVMIEHVLIVAKSSLEILLGYMKNVEIQFPLLSLQNHFKHS